MTLQSPAPLQSACQQAVKPTSAIPRLGPMCRHSRHTSPTAPQTLPVVPGEWPTLSAFSPFPTVRDCSAAARPLAGQPEMSPPDLISARPALPKTKPESRVKEDSGHTMSGIFYCPAVSFYVQVKFSFPTSILKPRM